MSWRCDDSIVTKTAKLSAKSPCSFQINYTLIQAPQLGSIQRRGRIETVGTGSNRRMTLKLRRLNFPKVKRPSIARAAMSIEARVRARATELYLGVQAQVLVRV